MRLLIKQYHEPKRKTRDFNQWSGYIRAKEKERFNKNQEIR